MEIQLIAVLAALACAIPGVFLVLRRMSLMSDAISHAVLLGIVLAFLVTRDLSSPLLLAGAAAAGVLTAAATEMLRQTRLVHNDSAIGLVFPVLFSIGVILIARNAGQVHLDTDAVLLGELAFAPFNRLTIGGADAGPVGAWVMGGILAANALLAALFYKELKISSFDPALAGALGFAPALLNYGLMTMVSVTAVGAFDAVGSILVVALMIVPGAAATLVAGRMSQVLLAACVIAVAGALGGYHLAVALDANIAGSIASVLGLLFTGVLLFSPSRGLVAMAVRSVRQQQDFAVRMLTIHVLHHEGRPEAASECRTAHLDEHLRWSASQIEATVRRAVRRELVRDIGGILLLTEEGRQLASESMVG